MQKKIGLSATLPSIINLLWKLPTGGVRMHPTQPTGKNRPDYKNYVAPTPEQVMKRRNQGLGISRLGQLKKKSHGNRHRVERFHLMRDFENGNFRKCVDYFQRTYGLVLEEQELTGWSQKQVRMALNP